MAISLFFLGLIIACGFMFYKALFSFGSDPAAGGGPRWEPLEPAKDEAAVTIDAHRIYPTELVGESHYQEELRKICGGRREDSADHRVWCCMVPDDGNEHDKKAVKCVISGMTVGYLSKDDARAFRKQYKAEIHAGQKLQCMARIKGGWYRSKSDQGHFGVRVDVALADEGGGEED